MNTQPLFSDIRERHNERGLGHAGCVCLSWEMLVQMCQVELSNHPEGAQHVSPGTSCQPSVAAQISKD